MSEHFDSIPASVLYKSLRREEYVADQANQQAKSIREALAKETGHGPSPAEIHPTLERGITCTCGWKIQGGYVSDKQRAVGQHVLTEWEKAASGDE